MSSSSDATKKKNAVWQEAGEEFYQESYPSGSGQQHNNCHQRRSSRHNYPLPSQTARRNSYALGRSKRTHGRDRDTGTNAFTYTSTMAVGTTANDIHVAVMPDLADMSIPNERKRWEELHKIKSMPIPMAQKRELKAQLTTIPMLKLKGWKRLRWKQKRLFQTLSVSWNHRSRTFIFWQSSLQDIEVRCGTSIVNVFLFIKWTLFLNIGISAIIIAFLILPYFVSGGRTDSTGDTCPVLSPVNSTYSNVTTVAQMRDCCTQEYYKDKNVTKFSDLIESGYVIDANGQWQYQYSPLFFGFYQAHEIVFPIQYNYAMVYALVTATIYGLCLILMVRQIGHGVKAMILAGEGEFYKYCNLIFAGWDHYTKDDAGARFKRKILRHEMKFALQSEKLKFQKTFRSKKQKWKLVLSRLLANVIVVLLQAVVGYLIYYVSELSIKARNENIQLLGDIAIGFIPSIFISVINIMFPMLLRQIGKMEKYSPEFQTTVILMRTLIVRLLSIAFIGYRYYKEDYCDVIDFTCRNCTGTGQNNKQRAMCWESGFAEEIYKIIVIDLALKLLIVFGVDVARVLIGRYIPGKLFKRIGTLKFNIVRHSLDIVYIQSLSWVGFYFAPFIPILVCFYLVIVFYIKKFQVLVTSQAIPDTFRTTRTTTIFIATKLISFAAVSLVMGLVIGYLQPSKECGPFREQKYPWQAVSEHILETNSTAINQMKTLFQSPGFTAPTAIILFMITYYYYAVAQANRNMVETLRHLLILEGHDKQYLFARLNTLRKQSDTSTLPTLRTAPGDDDD